MTIFNASLSTAVDNLRVIGNISSELHSGLLLLDQKKESHPSLLSAFPSTKERKKTSPRGAQKRESACIRKGSLFPRGKKTPSPLTWRGRKKRRRPRLRKRSQRDGKRGNSLRERKVRNTRMVSRVHSTRGYSIFIPLLHPPPPPTRVHWFSTLLAGADGSRASVSRS